MLTDKITYWLRMNVRRKVKTDGVRRNSTAVHVTMTNKEKLNQKMKEWKRLMKNNILSNNPYEMIN